MLRRLLGVFALVLLIAACESASDEQGTASTGGSGSGAGDQSTTSTLPPPGSSYSSSGLSSPGSGGRGGLGASEAERELVSIGDTVFFAFDSYALDSQAQATLDRQASMLLRNGAIAVTIEGHTDERGTREYNLALGDRRASAVKDYLVAFGIAPGRIRTISYGEERPAVIGSNEAAWAKNRRAVTVVVGSVAGS